MVTTQGTAPHGTGQDVLCAKTGFTQGKDQTQDQENFENFFTLMV